MGSLKKYSDWFIISKSVFDLPFKSEIIEKRYSSDKPLGAQSGFIDLIESNNSSDSLFIICCPLNQSNFLLSKTAAFLLIFSREKLSIRN